MFETAAWDDDDGGGPQSSALTWAAARRECVKQENETNSGSNVKRNDKKSTDDVSGFKPFNKGGKGGN